MKFLHLGFSCRFYNLDMQIKVSQRMLYSTRGTFLSSNITVYHSTLFLLGCIDIFEFTWTEIMQSRFLNAFCFHVYYIIDQFCFVFDVILLQSIEKMLNKWNGICLIPEIWLRVKVFSWNKYTSAKMIFSNPLSSINSDLIILTKIILSKYDCKKIPKTGMTNMCFMKWFLPVKTNMYCSVCHPIAQGRNCFIKWKSTISMLIYYLVASFGFVNLDLGDRKTPICVQWIFYRAVQRLNSE